MEKGKVAAGASAGSAVGASVCPPSSLETAAVTISRACRGSLTQKEVEQLKTEFNENDSVTALSVMVPVGQGRAVVVDLPLQEADRRQEVVCPTITFEALDASGAGRCVQKNLVVHSSEQR
jgi:hypothetical protein